VLELMLAPLVAEQRVVIHRRMKTVAITTEGDRITALTALGLDDGRLIRFHPELVIDATELGGPACRCAGPSTWWVRRLSGRPARRRRSPLKRNRIACRA
jgi:hypothetical protein